MLALKLDSKWQTCEIKHMKMLFLNLYKTVSISEVKAYVCTLKAFPNL